MDTVSIVVPVYNVSVYLDRCLESLTRQTYRDLEIIVVDDGSTDDSGAKCDIWATKDSRIKVIHQTNRGLSGARNTGLDNVSGEFVLLVDSDDYVDYEYVNKLHEKAIASDSDITICNYKFVDDSGVETVNDNYTVFTSEQCFDAIDALLLFENKAYRTFFDVVWNKMFRRELFEGVRFPEGVSVVEDISVMPILYHSAKRMSVISDCLYYYVYREDSLSHVKRSVQEDLDIRIPMMEDRLGLYREWRVKELMLLHITHLFSLYRKSDKDCKKRFKTLQKEFRGTYFKGKYSKEISLSRRVKFTLAAVSLRLYDKIAASR